jgi:hypothetical protein
MTEIRPERAYYILLIQLNQMMQDGCFTGNQTWLEQ